MKMVSVNFLLPFLCAAHTLQDISRGDTGEIFSNLSEAVVDENEILSMIEQQAALCPYIPLCTYTNRSTSTFIANKTRGYPCCSECSCQVSCIAEGTCCPDFVYRESEVKVESVKQKEAETITNGMRCVRTHHGILNKNNDGYQMIALCPDNFTNEPIKQRCESNIHIRDTDTLVDVIPIFHKESTMSYKNIFCYLCNKAVEKDINDGTAESAKFWDSRLYCMSSIYSPLYSKLDPLKFGKGLLQFGCSIVFYYSYGTENSSEPCTFDDIIETCKSQYVATKLEAQCKHFRWPITRIPQGTAYRIETYKNYACMLCNGRHFSENCFQYTPDLSLSSLFLTKTEPAFVANLIQNKPEKSFSDQIYINQTIDRYFPDSSGNIPCGKGFILDKEKNECRRVFCPQNFFLSNGSCFPMFDKTEGLFYYHLFEVIFPATLNIEYTGAFEDALVLASKKSLNKRIGAGKYNLTLWSNEHIQSKLDQKYFVLVFLDDKYADGNYIEILTVFLKLGTSKHQLVVVEKNRSKKIFEIEFRLTMDFKLRHQNVIVGIAGEMLHQRRPKSFPAERTIFQVTMSLLCFRIPLAISEADVTKSRVSFLVKRTNKIVSYPNFQRLKSEFDVRFLVCLEYALNDIANTSKYIFDEYPSKKEPSRITLNKGERRKENHEYANNIETENEANLFERSIVTSVVTMLVAFIVVGSRMLLKRLTNR